MFEAPQEALIVFVLVEHDPLMVEDPDTVLAAQLTAKLVICVSEQDDEDDLVDDAELVDADFFSSGSFFGSSGVSGLVWGVGGDGVGSTNFGRPPPTGGTTKSGKVVGIGKPGTLGIGKLWYTPGVGT